LSDPFTNALIRNWFLDGLDPPSEFTDGSRRVSMEGSGPFQIAELQGYFLRAGIDAVFLRDPEDAEADEVLVLGRDEVSPGLLEWLIEQRAGERLRVYSQEMFLTYWAVGEDPFEAGIDILEAFRLGHPGLEMLPEIAPAFVWPSCHVGDYDSSVDDAPLEPIGLMPSPGVLAALGYKVGLSGLPDARRRELLRAAFEHPLDDLRDRIGLQPHKIEAYLAEWGLPGSGRRLQRIAQSLAAFARNGARRGPSYKTAVQHWVADLAWLKAKYYQGRFGRQVDWWPSAHVEVPPQADIV